MSADIQDSETASLRTPRLTGRPLCAADFEDICVMDQDEETMRYVGGARAATTTRAWILRNMEHWEAHGFGMWTFRRSEGGSFVGRSGLRRAQVAGSEEVKLGYGLLKPYWGQGLAAEMAMAALAFGFERLRLESVIALIDEENGRSRKLAARLGFAFEQITTWKSLPTMLYRLRRGAPSAVEAGRIGD